MSTDLELESLVSSSKEMDYAATGFHKQHVTGLDNIVPLAKRFLEAGHQLEMITCQDRRAIEKTEGEGTEDTMRLCYSFNSLQQVDRHLVHIDLDPEQEQAPTLSEVFGGANWFEREVFEMYGVSFADHPYLQRLLLPEDTDFFALRKDFGRMEDAESEEGDDD